MAKNTGYYRFTKYFQTKSTTITKLLNHLMDTTDIKEKQFHALACANCGAELKYKPGTITLICEYCSSKNEIKQEQTILEELDFNDYLKESELEELELEKVIQCKSCGSISSVEENLKSSYCPYCKMPLLEDDIRDERFIKPGYLLPFSLDTPQVYNILSTWLDGLWWAPDNLKKMTLSPMGLRGVYVPYWTFDVSTSTTYNGEKGENYSEIINIGKNKIPVTRTNWFETSGSVFVSFDDLLSPASTSINENLLLKLFPWDLNELIKMNNDYLSGFITEKYRVTLKEGFHNVKNEINNQIRNEIYRDIGGDAQRINNSKTVCSDIKFKHILLPIYVSSYRYNNKIFNFYVNGRTGKLIGERPYSNLKIAFTLIGVLILLIIIIIL
jgi:hypothetical protein